MKRLSIISFLLVFIFALSSCEEPVVEVKVSSITLNSESLSMTEGETFKLNATVFPDNATDKTVVWSTSNAGIASVEEGMVTAVKEGTATITVASKDGGAKATCPVIVSAKTVAVESVTLDRKEATMSKGETLTLKATVKPANATEAVVWTSNNPSVATVKDGVVTAVSIGAASITATAGGKNASCTITVKESYIPVSSISLSQSSLSVMEGETSILRATVSPSDATEQTVSWESSNESIATVYGGKVTGVKAGYCTVTARAGDKSATCEVQVTAIVPVESVTLNYNELTLLIGDTETLEATVVPDYATHKTVSWTSSDSNIVSVRSNGTITARAVGTATVTATADGKSASCTVTVNPIEAEEITLSTTYLAMNPDDYETLTVTYKPENVTDKTVTWESSNTDVVTVSEGTLHAVAKGSAVITAKCGKATATCEVKVNDSYLTITNLTNYSGEVTIKASGATVPTITLMYSNDKGNTWTALNNIRTTQTIPLPANGTVMLEGNNQTFCSTATTKGWWSISANVTHNISGNLMTISGDEETLASKYEFYRLFSGDVKLKSANYLYLTADKLSDYCYAEMFEGCTSLEQAPKPPAVTLAQGCYKSMFEDCKTLKKAPEIAATDLAAYCYNNMFKGCTALTTAPTLPATTMKRSCYEAMFEGCTALKTAPALPATHLEASCYQDMFKNCTALETVPDLPAQVMYGSCYNSMFYGCTSLKEAPALPAKVLAQGCYMSMFVNCTSLETAPDLPAATLAKQCYSFMFSNCFALTEAPVLPAKTLKERCYEQMFSYCSSVAKITCMATDISASGCTMDWTKGVALNGTFVKDPAMENWTTGTSGIPSGWTVEDFVEEEETEE